MKLRSIQNFHEFISAFTQQKFPILNNQQELKVFRRSHSFSFCLQTVVSHKDNVRSLKKEQKKFHVLRSKTDKAMTSNPFQFIST